MAHQRFWTTSSKASPPDVSQESKRYFNSHTNGQHSGSEIFEKNGGTKNQKITILSKEIWEILILEQIMITVEYLPTSLDKVVDLESCRKVTSSELVLCWHVFHNLCLKLGAPTADLFALRVSQQVAQYVVWKPNPYSIATDVMAIPGTQGHCYAFPPFCPIAPILNKIQHDQVHTVTMITTRCCRIHKCWEC